MAHVVSVRQSLYEVGAFDKGPLPPEGERDMERSAPSGHGPDLMPTRPGSMPIFVCLEDLYISRWGGGGTHHQWSRRASRASGGMQGRW